MSANNYIEIHKDGKEYVISDLCADDCEPASIEIRRTKSLKSAIEWAKEYQREFPVEYGIWFGEI